MVRAVAEEPQHLPGAGGITVAEKNPHLAPVHELLASPNPQTASASAAHSIPLAAAHHTQTPKHTNHAPPPRGLGTRTETSRIQHRPEPEAQAQDDDAVGESADASSSIPAAASTAQSTRGPSPRGLPPRVPADGWLAGVLLSAAAAAAGSAVGRGALLRPSRSGPHHYPRLIYSGAAAAAGDGVRSSLLRGGLRCFAGTGWIFSSLFPLSAVVSGVGARNAAALGAGPRRTQEEEDGEEPEPAARRRGRGVK